jgi:hypothetical protein
MVVGFTLDKNDPTKRIRIEYNSHEELAWCEAAELADAEQWEEANAKLDEYCECIGGFIRCFRDIMLTAKILVGLASIQKADYQNAYNAVCSAISKSDGDEQQDATDLLVDLAVLQIKEWIPKETENKQLFDFKYKEASTEGLCKAAELWAKYLKMLAFDFDILLSEYHDNPADSCQCIVDELIERKEIAKAAPIAEKLKKADPDFFNEIYDEDWKPHFEKKM